MTTSPTAIPNEHQPRAGLLTAGQPDAAAWRSLASRGVTTVINLRTQGEMAGRDERREVMDAGMAYREVPVDGADGITLPAARLVQSLIAEARGAVLVHCGTANRAGALLALAQADAGVPEDQALAFGRAAGMTSAEPRVRAVLASASTP